MCTKNDKHMPPMTRGNDLKKGSAIVRRAIRHGIVPEFKYNVPFNEQTTGTQWALHVLAALSKNGKASMGDVKSVIKQTEDLLDGV